MTRALILGATGMLGHELCRVLTPAVSTVTAARSKDAQIVFDCETDDIATCISAAGNPAYVINAIGVIKPHINETDPVSRARTLEVNSLFPHRLANAAVASGAHVIQIATDCVYSGTTGGYDEDAPHDPWDVYGKSKSLGELPHPNVTHLRCSIIGAERGRSTSLWEWVIGQPQNGTITGYTNHFWNGVTTHAFARMCRGIIEAGWTQAGTFHVIPADVVSKAALVRYIAHANGRGDLTVEDGLGGDGVDRSLTTLNPEINRALWELAGYGPAPTIEALVYEAASGV